MLIKKKVLLVQVTGFNWEKHGQFRIVFLPHKNDLTEAINHLADFFDGYSQ